MPNYEDPNKNFAHDHCRYADRPFDLAQARPVRTDAKCNGCAEPSETGRQHRNDPNNFKVNEIIDDSDIAEYNNDNVTRFLSGTDPEGGSLTWAVKNVKETKPLYGEHV